MNTQNILRAQERAQQETRAFAFEPPRKIRDEPLRLVPPPVSGRQAPTFFAMLEAA